MIGNYLNIKKIMKYHVDSVGMISNHIKYDDAISPGTANSF